MPKRPRAQFAEEDGNDDWAAMHPGIAKNSVGRSRKQARKEQRKQKKQQHQNQYERRNGSAAHGSKGRFAQPKKKPVPKG